MKILLLGEYSRLHNTLKEGLLKLGHKVVLVGTGDSFKNYPVDINVSSPYRKSKTIKYLYYLLYYTAGYDAFKKSVYKQLQKHLPEFTNFDVVQLINEDPFDLYPKDQLKFLKQISNQNKNLFLSACGEDAHIIDYYLQNKMRYSILNPYTDTKKTKKEAYFSYKYLQPEYQLIHKETVNLVKAIIPSDLDYAIPYQNIPKAVPMIPNPVNVDNIQYKPLIINGKINIFFGINRLSFYKKGADIVLKVLDRIEQEYPERVNVMRAENLPYDTYIQKYNNAHIFIDQLYSYDQGFNALEAMAKGKCVLTGAEKEFEKYYGLQNQVAVNVLPDFNDVYNKLIDLIHHKEKIINTGREARKFIEKEHHYINIAKRYIDTWKQYSE